MAKEPPLVALVTDLDRTIASAEGKISRRARSTLARAQSMGLKTIVASGRPYAQLRRLVGHFGEIDALVAENGAVVEAPRGASPIITGAAGTARLRERLLRPPPIAGEWGEVIVSIPANEVDAARERADGLPIRWVLNVDRVMLLPAGITKASGVALALAALGRAGGAFAAIGDGENDVELLTATRLSAAVANAVPALRAVAAYPCRAPGEDGVAEFLDGPVSAHRLRGSA